MVEQENRYMYETAVTVGEDRHPAVRDIAQYFNYRHLPPGRIRDTSEAVAKDCFVRAALPKEE